MRKISTEREEYQVCLQRCIMAVDQLPADCVLSRSRVWWLYCVCAVTVCLSLHQYQYPQQYRLCSMAHELYLTSFICNRFTVSIYFQSYSCCLLHFWTLWVIIYLQGRYRYNVLATAPSKQEAMYNETFKIYDLRQKVIYRSHYFTNN